MSVLIKGMKMPKDCRECKMLTYYSTSGCSMCDISGNALARNFKPIPFDDRPDWCPLVEIPEPHGDLIDRSMLDPDSEYEDGDFGAVSVAQIKLMPTVIEAERGED